MGFVFGKAVEYFQRNEEKYGKVVQYMYGRVDVKKEIVGLLVKDRQKVAVLEVAVVNTDKGLTKEEERRLEELLQNIKIIKVTKLLESVRQYSAKSLPFEDSNLDFFNEIMKCTDFTVFFDLTKTDRTKLFSSFLFEAYNIRDYDDFAEFLTKSETRSEEYFEKNMGILKQILKLWIWLNDL